MDNELVEYFVVNQELNMSTGKVSAQVGHVSTIIAVDLCRRSRSLGSQKHIWFWEWFECDQKKIILRGKQKDLERLIEQGFYHIKDNGLTEIPEGSLTAVGLPPMPREVAKKYVKRLQLL